MMRPSREALVLAAGLLVAAGGASALLRRDADEEGAAVAKRAARVYDSHRPVNEPYAVADLKAYWLGVDITGVRSPKEGMEDRFEPIAVPPPPDAALVVPPLRPWPAVRPPRPLPLVEPGPAAPTAAPEGAPLRPVRPPPDQLLPAAELEALLALPAPADVVVPDRRAEKVRESDIVYMAAVAQPQEGKILAEPPGQNFIIFVNKKGGFKQTIPKDQIRKIERACTHEEQIALDSKAVKAGDAAARQKLAARCLELGMLPEAVAEMERAVEAKEGDTALALELAALYRRAGRFENELQTLRAAAEKGASSREKAWLALADFYRVFGLLDEALEAARMAAKVAPGDADALVLQAEIELERGDWERAVETATKAIDRSKGAPRAVAARAGACLARGELERARADLERLVTGGAVHAPAANLLGVVQFLQGAPGEAAKSFALAARTDPAQVPAITNLGILYLMAGRGEEARKLFQLAAARDPADAMPVAAQALCVLVSAKSAPAKVPAPPANPAPVDGGAPAAEPPGAAAKALLEQALAIDPGCAYVEYALGMNALLLQAPEEAERHLRAALRGGTDAVPVLYALGSVLLAAGRGAEAEVCFARIAERGDATPEEQAALAIARCASGDFEKAIADLQRLQVAHPRMVHVWNALGYIDYMHHRKVKDALAKFDQARACDPSNSYALVTGLKIKETTTTALTEETFDRPDADEVGRVWVEIENTGVDVKVVDQRCLFSGTQKLNDWADTAIVREVPGAAFIQFEAEFDYRDLERAVAGLRLTYAVTGGVPKSVLLARDDRGRFVYADVPGNVIVPQWKSPPAKVEIPPLPGNPVGATGKPIVRLKIVAPPLDDSARNKVFDCYVNDTLIGTLQTSLREQAERYDAAVVVRAMKGTPIEFTVDNIRIIERKGE